jgi:dTDP-4-amino-4,6-dideoxygalactose transaminase
VRQELKNMVEAALDGWLTTGRFNAEFERNSQPSSASST